MKNIKVSYQDNYRLSKSNINRVIKYLISELNLTVSSVEINFVSGNVIQNINKKYLKHNYITDIITFSYSSEGEPVDAEIFICSQAAKENSVKYKVTLDEEITRLIVHGFLHIVGFDDQTDYKRRKMRAKENELLSKYLSNS